MDGYDYAAVGNSTSKKDAQSNAARDFLQYLVRIGEVQQSEVPSVGVSGPYLLFGHNTWYLQSS